MKIQNFQNFSLYDSMAQDFIKSFDKLIAEKSEENDFKLAQDKVISDLKLNIQLSTTFGAGIGALYPIVYELMKNGTKSIEITNETIAMLTLASIAIIFIEEKKFRDSDEELSLTKDSKSLLEELKMRGVGNGIVKKVIKVITSIKNVFQIIVKHLGTVVSSIIDMFAYTSMLIPIMNGVLFIVGKYELNIDSFCENFLGLSIGVSTIIAKYGISYILNKLKDKFKVNKSKVLSDIEDTSVKKFSTFGDGEGDQQGDMINEQ